MNCTQIYNSSKVQNALDKAWKNEMASRLKKEGGLDNGAWQTYKKFFKKGFMNTCKKIKKTAIKKCKQCSNKTKKSR